MRQALACAALVLMAGWLSACATTKGAPESRPGGALVQMSSITAVVEKINYKTRMVTLKGPEGNLVTLKVGEEAKNFNQVNKGDRVTFQYYEALAVDVRKSDAKPMAVESERIARAAPGEKPGGVVESTSSVSAKVENIDYKTRMVKLRGPEGNVMSLKVGDQVKRLNEVSGGDLVIVTYTQAVAISVSKP